MSQIFPSTLPDPEAVSYSFSPENALLRTKMDSGRARQRRVFTRSLTTLSVQWRLSGAQFNTFKAWWEQALRDGAESFFLKVWRADEFRHAEVRFTGQYQASLDARSISDWVVSGTVELLDATDFIMASEKSAVVHSISGRLPYYRKAESVIIGDLPANNTVTEVLVIGRGDIGAVTTLETITVGYTGDTNAYVNAGDISGAVDNVTVTFTPGTGADSTAREVVAQFGCSGTPASGEYIVIIQYTV